MKKNQNDNATAILRQKNSEIQSLIKKLDWRHPATANNLDLTTIIDGLESERAALVAVVEALPEILAHLDAHSRQTCLERGRNSFFKACNSAPEFGAKIKLIPAAKAAREALANLAAVREGK